MADKKKIYALDTSVLLHDPFSVLSFGDNIIVIPIPVVNELDKFKEGSRTINRNAREVIRLLDKLRKKGELAKGVPLNEGRGTLKIVPLKKLSPSSPDLWATNDEKILSIVKGIAGAEARKDSPKEVILVSRDINMRVRANVMGLEAQSHKSNAIPDDKFYTGLRIIDSEELFQEFAWSDTLAYQNDLLPNEFVMVRRPSNQKQTLLGMFDAQRGKIVRSKDMGKIWGIQGNNLEQKIAIELLLRPEIQLVTLSGRAGTGKTLLALACALQKTRTEKIYDKILIYRPIWPFGGKDMGALPGDLGEKLAPWMEAIDDNLEFLALINQDKCKNKEDQRASVDLDRLFGRFIEKNSLTYIRGRSIPKSFIIIDEAQNLTPKDVKTIVTRVRDDTKIVFTGDPDQIDQTYLDRGNNGLVYIIEKMKHSDLSGHITLTKSVRGKLAEYAAKVL